MTANAKIPRLALRVIAGWNLAAAVLWTVVSTGPVGAQSCTWGGTPIVAPPNVTALGSLKEWVPGSLGRMTVDSDGQLYATDAKEGRIVVLDRFGTLVSTFPTVGTPVSIALQGAGNLVVAERDFGSATVHAIDGQPLFALGIGAGEFVLPTDIDTDVQERIYVADGGAHQVKVYSPWGQHLSTWGAGGRGTSAGRFDFPSAVHVASSGEVFVADQNNDRIQVFDANGTFLRCFGRRGSFAFGSRFGRILDITGDTEGRLYVADAFHSHVAVFDLNGVLLSKIGSFGDGDGQLRTPIDVVVDPSNRLLVSSANNQRLEIFGIDDFTHETATPTSTPTYTSTPTHTPPPTNTPIPTDTVPPTTEPTSTLTATATATPSATATAPTIMIEACNNCIDDDGDGLVDAEDTDCSLLAPAVPYAVIAGVDSTWSDVSIGRKARITKVAGGLCPPEAAYPGGSSGAEVCGSSMVIYPGTSIEGRATSVAGNVRFTAAAPATAIYGGFVAVSEPFVAAGAVSQPLVGPPAVCSDTGSPCTADWQCAGGTCLPALAITDALNPHVRVGGLPIDDRCLAARAALGTHAAEIDRLEPTDTVISDLNVEPFEPAVPCLLDAQLDCPTREVAFGPGLSVIDVDAVDLAPGGQLLLAGHSSTVLVVRVHGSFHVGPGALIQTADGLSPDRILWRVDGSRVPVTIGERGLLSGTVLAPNSPILLGTRGIVVGTLHGKSVTLQSESSLHHIPFVGLVEPR